MDVEEPKEKTNQESFKSSIWKPTKEEFGEDWKLFFNINEKDKTKSKPSKDQQIKLTDVNNKKNLILGSVVMTPSGFGKLTKIEKNICSVKLLKSNLEQNFEDSNIMLSFPIFIRIMDREFANWYKFTIPTSGNVETIKKQLEENQVVEKDKSYTLVFNGSELKDESFLDQIDFKPESKLLVFGLKNNICKAERFVLSGPINSWWYTYATDGLTFTVNKKIRLTGVAMYGSHEGKTQTGVLTILEGGSGIGQNALMKQDVDIPPSPVITDPYHIINLKKPVSLKPNQEYTLQFICTNYCYFYYSTGGQPVIQGEKKVQFTFKYTRDVSYGTSPEQGNFPIFYYFA